MTTLTEEETAWLARVDSTRTKLAEKLGLSSQGSNGDATYTNNQALMGHIEAAKFLMIPEDIATLCAAAPVMAVNLVEFGSSDGVNNMAGALGATHRAANAFFNYYTGERTEEQIQFDSLKIAALNYSTLVKSGISQYEAAYMSSLRARWMMTGALNALMSDNTNSLVEHIVVTTTDLDYGSLVAATDLDTLDGAAMGHIEEYLDATELAGDVWEWVLFNAEAIWAAVEFVFRTRSHHFKSIGSEAASYTALYNKYFSASFEGDAKWPAGLSMFNILHTAIHPFKVRALPVVTAHYLAYGKLSESAKLRLHGSPCGHAIITTTVAALTAMRSESWWKAFETVFGDAIKRTISYGKQIDSNRYSYHQAAGLYGLTHLNTLIDPVDNASVNVVYAKNDVMFIAAACQGLIQALNTAVDTNKIKGFSLSNSKALQKAAANAPLITTRIATLILRSLELAADTSTLSDLVEATLPEYAQKMKLLTET